MVENIKFILRPDQSSGYAMVTQAEIGNASKDSGVRMRRVTMFDEQGNRQYSLLVDEAGAPFVDPQAELIQGK